MIQSREHKDVTFAKLVRQEIRARKFRTYILGAIQRWGCQRWVEATGSGDVPGMAQCRGQPGGGRTGQEARARRSQSWGRGRVKLFRGGDTGRLPGRLRLVTLAISCQPLDASYPFLESPFKAITMHRP